MKYLSDLVFSFLFFYFELFSAFNCANSIGILVNSFFGVETFNPFPFLTSSPSSASIGGKSVDYPLSIASFVSDDFIFSNQTT